MSHFFFNIILTVHFSNAPFSILTLITKGESSILLSGDIDIQVDTEATLAKEIFDDVGYIVKVGIAVITKVCIASPGSAVDLLNLIVIA